jgi:hypothetical protein
LSPHFFCRVSPCAAELLSGLLLGGPLGHSAIHLDCLL